MTKYEIRQPAEVLAGARGSVSLAILAWLQAWVRVARTTADDPQRMIHSEYRRNFGQRRSPAELYQQLGIGAAKTVKLIGDEYVSTTETIPTETREGRGSQFAKQLRASGKTPAVVYGHGQKTVEISVPTDKLVAAVRQGAHVVRLEGVINESALLKHIQWDALGSDMLHIDFTRVDASESAQVELKVELRGVAPGTKMGGVVDQGMRAIEIDCPVLSIPEKLQVSINELELDGTITAAEVSLPAGAKLVTDPATVVASCVVPVVHDEDEEAALATGAEPEVIGAKPDEEGDSSD